MPKKFADRDQTKCSSQDGNFKPGQTIVVPEGGRRRLPSILQKLGKIQIFRAVTRKYMGKTRIFRAAI